MRYIVHAVVCDVWGMIVGYGERALPTRHFDVDAVFESEAWEAAWSAIWAEFLGEREKVPREQWSFETMLERGYYAVLCVYTPEQLNRRTEHLTAKSRLQ